MSAQKHLAVVTNTVYLNHKIIKVDLELTDQQKFLHIPGHHISVNVAPSTYRTYSLYATSISNKDFSIIASVQHDGVGSKYLKDLKKGDQVNFIGPAGHFTLNPVPITKNIFIATGTGVSPILYMINHLALTKKIAEVQLAFGARNKNELFMQDHIQKYQNKFSKFKAIYCLSKESESPQNQLPSQDNSDKPNQTSIDSQNINYFYGRVTDWLINNIQKDAHYYICGNPNMIMDVLQILKDNNINQTQIHDEGFTVSKK